ncbi:hypothetical protein GGI18_000136 [Coemansia linderi]|uniref:Uncharacterized protein n=1 Tax=Coemansia linderi TaxID=2663919 RepID=A0ACC1KPG1_9FUNG|nr:hypothetical protein GGI18_000136 [Coemansia linderi]
MAEVITYEDSPLAQYLQEIDASETFVAEDKPDTADIATSNSPPTALSAGVSPFGEWLRQLAARPLAAPNGHKAAAVIAKEMYARVLSTLADSGLVAERYTPRPFRSATQPQEMNIPAAPPRSTLSIGSGFVLAMTPALATFAVLPFRPKGLSKMDWSVTVTVLIIMPAIIAIIALLVNELWQQRERKRNPIGKCNDVVTQVNCMVLRCRAMDGAVQRALRQVMDVDFVTRGFRLPQYRGSLAISSRPGRGTAWMAEHVRQAVDSALSESIGAFADSIEHSELQPGQMESFLDSDTRVQMADLRAQLDDASELGSMTLEALRLKFALHFAMRKLWLESVVRTLESNLGADIRPEQLLSLCELLGPDIARVSEAAGLLADRVKEASEAQFTARKWASLAATKADSAESHHPLVRALGSMSEALETVRAKILVCRECVSMVEDDVADSEDAQAVPSAEEIARVFASLKTDIDALNHLYQASVTSLAFYDSGSGPTSGDNDGSVAVPAELMDFEQGSTAIPDGATVFGYTPVGGDDLDAPELIFEAEIEQGGGQERLKVAYTNRSSQLLQVASARKNDIVGMISELKSAIDSRSKASTSKQAPKE